eukprot:5214555-Prymnesium_polylepis.1
MGLGPGSGLRSGARGSVEPPHSAHVTNYAYAVPNCKWLYTTSRDPPPRFSTSQDVLDSHTHAATEHTPR